MSPTVLRGSIPSRRSNGSPVLVDISTSTKTIPRESIPRFARRISSVNGSPSALGGIALELRTSTTVVRISIGINDGFSNIEVSNFQQTFGFDTHLFRLVVFDMKFGVAVQV
jgi:hypothetical protein